MKQLEQTIKKESGSKTNLVKECHNKSSSIGAEVYRITKEGGARKMNTNSQFAMIVT